MMPGAPMPKYLLILLYCLMLIGSVGCSRTSTSPAPSPGPSKEPLPVMQPLTQEEVQSILWSDDLDFERLFEAIEQSLRYYGRLPDSSQFQYGEIRYSAREMEASMHHLLDILQTHQGDARIQAIQKNFLFFESKNSKKEAFFTGYYEPILQGRRTPTQEFNTPLYETPKDLLKADLGIFNSKLKGQRIIGKVKGNRFVPYDSREEIAYRQSLKNRANPLIYVKNDIELFFLQIQGSGLVQLPNGVFKRLNYASQNGHSYRSIGRLLIEENKIPREKMSMQSLKKYLYNHPQEVKRILNHNPSYTFFREVKEGPLGYIEVPLTPERSIAMDRKLIPKGGLAFIATQIPLFENEQLMRWKPVKRFVLVQDTGGAIRGHGRADIFFGHGKLAELKAGHMQQWGRIFLIVARKEFLASDLMSQQ